MNKKAVIGIIVVIIVIILAVVLLKKPSSGPSSDTASNEPQNSESATVSETTKVSSKLSEYQNAELGFSVKYPSGWQKEEGNAGVTFIIPVDKAQVSTIGTLQASVQVITGTCAFPPVTTIKDRATVKVGDLSFNTISMSNTVQGRNYFNRLYSLQKGDICYMFSLASITLSASSKGLTGSNAAQAENNNKAIVTSADASFTDMVKSFAFVTGPQGVDETKATPKK